MEFYKIKNNGLSLSNKLFQEDIVFIIDGIAGYIWKGKNAAEMDEITAKEVEIIIDEKFKGMSFDLIMDLDIKKTDNLKISQIKKEIIKRLPRSFIKMKRTAFIKTRVSKIYGELKDYEVPIEWRKKLSTRLILWKLSIFNCFVIVLCIILMIDLIFFHLILDNYLLYVVLICLLIMLSVNLIFVIFPMKFPKKFFIEKEKTKGKSN